MLREKSVVRYPRIENDWLMDYFLISTSAALSGSLSYTNVAGSEWLILRA